MHIVRAPLRGSWLGVCLPAALLVGCQAHVASIASTARTSPEIQVAGSAPPPPPAQTPATDAKAGSKTLLALDLDFEFNSAKLISSDKKTIATNVTAICKLVEKHKALTIEGHADSRGPAEHNLQLSQERAEAVREEILANKRCHIEPAQLSAVGYGEKEPRRCHEPPQCDGKDNGPKTCENCWNENRMTIIALPLEPAPAPPPTAAPPPPAAPPAAASSNCSRVLMLGQERGSRMCEQPKGS
jgi:outer membrane protein OmpA-like peptidoglycan-associated protein